MIFELWCTTPELSFKEKRRAVHGKGAPKMAQTRLFCHNRGAYRYATPWDLERFKYTLNLAMLAATLEAAAIVEERTRRAKRVLSFFAALHRSGKSGYLGTQCTRAQMSEAIQRATGEPCGVSTLSAALGELKAAGLLTSTSYALPGAKPIETAPGQFIVRKIKIWSLTPLAISLWTKPRKPRKKKGCDKVLPVQKMDTLGSLDISFFQKENIPNADPEIVPAPESRTVEKVKPSGTDGASPRPCGLKQKPRHPAAIASTGSDTDSGRKDRQKGEPQPVHGVSYCAPPDNVPKSRANTRKTARARLLRDLWFLLRPWWHTKANQIYKRARAETAPDFPTHWGTATNWDHHLNRWHAYSYAERQRTLKREIVPALKVSPELPNGDSNRTVAKITGFLLQENPPERLRVRHPEPLPCPEPPPNSGGLLPNLEKTLRGMVARLEAAGKTEQAAGILAEIERKKRR